MSNSTEVLKSISQIKLLEYEREILKMKLNILLAEIKMQGMKAENEIFKLHGNQPPYGLYEFNRLIQLYNLSTGSIPLIPMPE